jgi:large subunit ribosomal protein L24
MIESAQPRRQRRFRFNAGLHQRQHFVHAHIDETLRKKLGLKRNAVQLSKGDTVRVVSGSKKGASGKVTKVSLRSGRVLIDSLMKKNAKGKEFGVPISASNVYITDFALTDKRRAAKLKVAVAPKQQAPEANAVKQEQGAVKEAAEVK